MRVAIALHTAAIRSGSDVLVRAQRGEKRGLAMAARNLLDERVEPLAGVGR